MVWSSSGAVQLGVEHAYRVIVAILFAPHEGRLEFGEFIGSKLFAGQYQTHNVLWQQRKTAQIQHFVAVLIDEFEHFLHQTFGALVLNVSFGRCEERTHRINIDATLYETGTSATQLLESIVVGRIHDTEQSAWL